VMNFEKLVRRGLVQVKVLYQLPQGQGLYSILHFVPVPLLFQTSRERGIKVIVAHPRVLIPNRVIVVTAVGVIGGINWAKEKWPKETMVPYVEIAEAGATESAEAS